MPAVETLPHPDVSEERPMKLNPLERRLYDAFAAMEIVDAHEHLAPEKEYLARDCCGPNLFAHYLRRELVSAGMPPEYVDELLLKPGYRAVEEWWPRIAPYWERVKEGSYARAARITARDLYGVEDINDHTIHELAEKVRADNTPGLYHRILREKCNIRAALTCVRHTQFKDDPLLRPVIYVLQVNPVGSTWESARRFGDAEGVEVRNFDDLLEAQRRKLSRLKAEGAVGFKVSSTRRTEPTEGQAREVFDHMSAVGSCENPAPLLDYLFWKLLETAGDLEVPVAVHAGVWGDFRTLDAKWMIPYAMRCPTTHFDLFHLGIPDVNDAIIIAKNFPNVSLNLCWTYILSQQVTLEAIGRILDLVPVNKVIGFGGDYWVIQKVYGHLVMARETLARAFARRIADGAMTEDRAVEIGGMWLSGNPARIYGV